VPPRGYANLSVRRDLLDKLQRLREELQLGSISDLLAHLLAEHTRCEKLEERLRAVEKRLEELEATNRKLYLAVKTLLEEHQKHG